MIKQGTLLKEIKSVKQNVEGIFHNFKVISKDQNKYAQRETLYISKCVISALKLKITSAYPVYYNFLASFYIAPLLNNKTLFFLLPKLLFQLTQQNCLRETILFTFY